MSDNIVVSSVNVAGLSAVIPSGGIGDIAEMHKGETLPIGSKLVLTTGGYIVVHDPAAAAADSTESSGKGVAPAAAAGKTKGFDTVDYLAVKDGVLVPCFNNPKESSVVVAAAVETKVDETVAAAATSDVDCIHLGVAGSVGCPVLLPTPIDSGVVVVDADLCKESIDDVIAKVEPTVTAAAASSSSMVDTHVVAAAGFTMVKLKEMDQSRLELIGKYIKNNPGKCNCFITNLDDAYHACVRATFQGDVSVSAAAAAKFESAKEELTKLIVSGSAAGVVGRLESVVPTDSEVADQIIAQVDAEMKVAAEAESRTEKGIKMDAKLSEMRQEVAKIVGDYREKYPGKYNCFNANFQYSYARCCSASLECSGYGSFDDEVANYESAKQQLAGRDESYVVPAATSAADMVGPLESELKAGTINELHAEQRLLDALESGAAEATDLEKKVAAAIVESMENSARGKKIEVGFFDDKLCAIDSLIYRVDDVDVGIGAVFTRLFVDETPHPESLLSDLIIYHRIIRSLRESHWDELNALNVKKFEAASRRKYINELRIQSGDYGERKEKLNKFSSEFVDVMSAYEALQVAKCGSTTEKLRMAALRVHEAYYNTRYEDNFAGELAKYKEIEAKIVKLLDPEPRKSATSCIEGSVGEIVNYGSSSSSSKKRCRCSEGEDEAATGVTEGVTAGEGSEAVAKKQKVEPMVDLVQVSMWTEEVCTSTVSIFKLSDIPGGVAKLKEELKKTKHLCGYYVCRNEYLDRFQFLDPQNYNEGIIPSIIPVWTKHSVVGADYETTENERIIYTTNVTNIK